MRQSRYTILSIMLLAIIYMAACDSDGDSSNSPGNEPNITNQFGLIDAFPNLAFQNPLDIQNAADGTNRLFVAEQRGVLHVIDNLAAVQASDTSLRNATSGVFLDIQDRVAFDIEFELLGFAFHPDFANNGYLYINYTTGNPGRTIISRFEVSQNNPNTADPDSELILLDIEQPHPFHNGGQLVFGPQDGYLYIALGDGGPASGPATGQNLTDLLGTVIRIDVDNPQGQLNYGIPPDNPFANNTDGYREEIYAYGFRNPWRLAFDPVSGNLWTGDVGEISREELNIVRNGGNYGWSIVEGTQCFDPPSGCNPEDFELPELEYGRGSGGSVIGGVFYYGDEFPELEGLYLYADFVSGRVWALEHDGTSVVANSQLLRFNPNSIVAFGLDEQAEPYIASFDGNIYRLERVD